MVTTSQLSGILKFEPLEKQITSFYISVDEEGKKNNKHKIILKDLLKYKSGKSYFKNLKDTEKESVQQDFKKIEDYVNMEFDMDGNGSRSVAIFSCSEEDLWESMKFSVPMETSMVVNTHPYLRPLVEAASLHRNYAIILVDRAKARIVENQMGNITEHMHVHIDDMPDQVKKGDFEGTSERRYERHINDHVRRHLKRVAEEAKKLQEQHDYKWIYIGGRQDVINEFEKLTHSYIKERIQGHLIVEPHASMDEVLEKASDAEKNSLNAYEKQLLDRLQNEVGAGNLGISGMAGVLRAQQQGQVDTLLVQHDYSQKGFYCPDCNYLTIEEGNRCPIDETKLRRTPDIVDNLIYNVLKQGASVEMVTKQMDDFSDIGAFLRFPFTEQARKTG